MSATGDDRAGATLLEAMVTVAVLALISAMVFPEFRPGVSRAAFEEAAAGLRADLRIARAQAETGGAAVDLRIDASGAAYGWTPGPQRGLVDGLRLEPAGATLSFFPDGSSTGGRLRLAGGPRTITFDVNPTTGVLGALQ